MERAGTDVSAATEALAQWRHNIYLVPQMIFNDVSSTKASSNNRFTGVSNRRSYLWIGSIIPSAWVERQILDSFVRYRLH